MRPKKLPSLEELQEYFTCDPLTGLLITKKRLATRTPENTVVGSKSSEGYLKVNFKYESYPVHRIIWKLLTGEEPEIIDHKNHIKTDNRLENLRSVTYQINNLHRSTAKGYSILPNGRLRVTFLGKDVGYYSDPEEAKEAFKKIRYEYSCF